jgi:hypothetical protein
MGLALVLLAPPAWGEEDAPPAADEAAEEPQAPTTPDDENTIKARDEFVRGAELVTKAQWAEALGAFERSLALRPHPVTRFNIGACERALGQYTRAQVTLRRALADDAAAGGGLLAESLAAEARGYIAEIDGLVARVRIVLRPRKARIAVDGRPLVVAGARGSRVVMVAGISDPGPGEAPPKSSFELVVNPGAHLITLSHKGFDDIVIARTFKAGSTTELPLKLNKLPGAMNISADQPRARVMVGGYDVGLTPTVVERPAGRYAVLVEKDGHVPWETRVTLNPGERVDLRAPLPLEEPAIWERWWFWTSAVAAIGTAVSVSVVVALPEAERPPPDGGGLGWVIDVR